MLVILFCMRSRADSAGKIFLHSRLCIFKTKIKSSVFGKNNKLIKLCFKCKITACFFVCALYKGLVKSFKLSLVKALETYSDITAANILLAFIREMMYFIPFVYKPCLSIIFIGNKMPRTKLMLKNQLYIILRQRKKDGYFFRAKYILSWCTPYKKYRRYT